MSDAFNSSPAWIGSLLNSGMRDRVAIPLFQRGYMWQKKHIEDFWEDVVSQKNKVPRGDPHFFGPIVTMAQLEDEIIYVLDGQQRLATATILLTVLRDVAREFGRASGIQAATDFAARLQFQFIEKEAGGYALELSEVDALYFSETIQHDPPINSKPKLRTHRNIKAARELLKTKVVSLVGQPASPSDTRRAIDQLAEIKKTVVSDLVMARIPVTSRESAFRIFETLNHRGLRLSPPDLLLSYLMEKALEPDRNDIRSIWTEMMQRMGTHDINRFMRHMWVSKYGDLKSQDLFTALKQQIEDEHIKSLDFARLCGDECEDYVQLIAVSEAELGEAAPFVRALVQELNFQPAMPLLLSCHSLLQRADFADVARWLLVFVTRYSIIANQDSTGMENLLFKLARNVRGMVRDPNTEPQQAEDSTESRRAAIYIKEQLVSNSPDDDAVKKAVEGLTLDSGAAKYVLSRLARHMQDPTRATTLGETNLEHIYPQNPSPDIYGGEAGQEIMEPFTWHLGNLTIFGTRANRKAGNKDFPTKRPRYAASTITMTKELAAKYDHWDVQTIKERAKSFARLVVEVWNFDNPSRV